MEGYIYLLGVIPEYNTVEETVEYIDSSCLDDVYSLYLAFSSEKAVKAALKSLRENPIIFFLEKRWDIPDILTEGYYSVIDGSLFRDSMHLLDKSKYIYLDGILDIAEYNFSAQAILNLEKEIKNKFRTVVQKIKKYYE